MDSDVSSDVDLLISRAMERELSNEKEDGVRRFHQSKMNIDDNSRKILIGWIHELKKVYMLTHETEELSVLILDAVFASRIWSIGQFQLVCATSLFLASKYEETYYPALSEFIYLCDGLYTKNEFLEMEKTILQLMGFRLTRMNYHSFTKFSICSYKPPEVFIKVVDFVAEKLLGVKGICQRDQQKVSKLMLNIIDKGFSDDSMNDEQSIEMRILKDEMIDAIKE